MLVCHCKAVSDREVRDAIREGASTRRQVARACGAGSRCGGCRPIVAELLEEECADDALGLEFSPAR